MADFRPELDDVLRVMSEKNHRIYAHPGGFDLNLVGIRSRSMVPHRFDDWVTVFYRSHGRWIYMAFPATTDPGVYWLGNPMNTFGTAVLKEGQYRSAYRIGTHKGYKALEQNSPLTVIRDYNRDGVIDYASGREDTGMFKLNIHRASRFNESVNVDRWSAGCQVLCDPLQFNYFLSVCEKGAAAFGNTFTYTLLHERDF